MFDRRIIVSVLFLFTVFSSHAMVYDYRWMPAFPEREIKPDGRQKLFAIDTFVAGASTATKNDESVSIPSLFGPFDQKKYADGMVKAGYENLLRPEWRGQSIPWTASGKIEAQGVAASWITTSKCGRFSTGINSFFMRMNTYEEFATERSRLTMNPDNIEELDEVRRCMFDTVGLVRNYVTRFGFGDIDWYLRYGRFWDYEFKCRTVDAGVRFGLLVPTGKKRNLHSPMSLPFGGNGHWGAYGAVDGLFEVREDLKCGVLLRISKRCAKTSCQRLTVNEEPGPLGIITGLARVNPGFTFVFSPLLAMENIRAGMGASLQYTLTKHLRDTWTDARADQKTVPVCLKQVSENSEWSSDYFTARVFYDFGKTKVYRGLEPIVSVRWDIPAALYVTDSIPNTHRVSMGVECVF